MLGDEVEASRAEMSCSFSSAMIKVLVDALRRDSALS